MGTRDWKTKNTPKIECVLFVAGRAGFECHPLNGDVRLENKNTPKTECVLFVAGRAGFEYHLLNGGTRLENKNTPLQMCFCLWRGGRDSNPRLVLPSTHLAGEPIQPLWHLPNFL